MKLIWAPEIEEILSVGNSLHETGNFNWALTRDQALEASEKLLRLGIPILGGDVYEIVGGKIRHNYDSWNCDPLPGELASDFVVRSVADAERYINNYQLESPQNKYYFTLTPDD